MNITNIVLLLIFAISTLIGVWMMVISRMFIKLLQMLVEKDGATVFNTILHDLQQIKTRLTWSKRREKKVLPKKVVKKHV